jgi:acyl-CoA reductase-like NAD-dependent aldehyde dehydrogenase
MTTTLQNLVGGSWVDQSGRDVYQIINPADGKSVVAKFAYSTPEDVAT